MIITELHEVGQNRSLDGRTRRTREMAGDRGYEDKYARAAPSAPTADKRRSILDDISEACEDGRHDEGHDHIERLREFDDRDDEDDGEMRSRESRDWSKSLRAGVSLKEYRAAETRRRKHCSNLRAWARSLQGA